MSNRPSVVEVIVVLWTIGSIINIAFGFYGFVGDLGTLPLLTDLSVPDYIRFALPTEMLLNLFLILMAFFSLYAMYELFFAKSWSYHLALTLSVIAAIIYLAGVLLYMTAPVEIEETLGLRQFAEANLAAFIISVVWSGFVWIYLYQPHVRQYLKVIPPSAPVVVSIPEFNAESGTATSRLTMSAQPVEQVSSAKTEEKKYCRYCGAEQKSDAVFCEKCGKRIG